MKQIAASDCSKHADSHCSVGDSSATVGPPGESESRYTVVISHCFHSSDLASFGKAYHWSPCPPAREN